jgi:F420H(2)-dependent quinone reductase
VERVDRVIDITTTGRKTGEPRRIEIWFHRLDGRYFITGAPGRPRDWYANKPGQEPEVWVASSPLVEVTLP